MDSHVVRFWQIRLADIKLSLEANSFDVFVAQNAAEARNIVLNKIGSSGFVVHKFISILVLL